LCIGFDLLHQDGTVVLRSNHNDRAERDWPPLHIGRNLLSCTIPAGLLSFGTYHFVPRIGLHGARWLINDGRGVSITMRLDHSDSPYWTTERRGKFPGVSAPGFEWVQLLDAPLSWNGGTSSAKWYSSPVDGGRDWPRRPAGVPSRWLRSADGRSCGTS